MKQSPRKMVLGNKPDNIVQVDFHDTFNNNMIRYSLYVLYNRYVPDIRDGLKPVQRRILYAMHHDIGCISKGTKRKSANTVGTVIAKYHAHGDCVGSDTLVYTLNGVLSPIGKLYKDGIRSFEALGINEQTGAIEPVVVHSLRIGQYTNEIYHIVLSNGSEIKCTGNHPIKLKNNTYIQAKDIQIGYSMKIEYLFNGFDNRPTIREYGRLQDLVFRFYNGRDVLPSHIKHHLDHNRANNTIGNLKEISREEHAAIHNNQTSLDGLAKGREAMSDKSTYAYTNNLIKNRVLMKEYNKDQNFRKFRKYMNELKEQGKPQTVEEYEKLRPNVYNLPYIDRLIATGRYGNSLEELLAYPIKSIGELYQEWKSSLVEMCTIIESKENKYGPKLGESYNNINIRKAAFSVFDYLAYNHIEFSFDEFINYYNGTHDYSINEYIILLDMYLNTEPYVVNVWVEQVYQIPMYDFTVDTTHNMLFPVIGANNDFNNFPMICMHNSSVYGAMKAMTNWFETKMPLILYDSNSGSLQGGPQAAMRYTESYLSPFSVNHILGELRENPRVVNWQKTFDNHTMEPQSLPVQVPLLLVNGCFGIAIGRRIEVPHHSLNDVIDATIELLHNPKAKVVLIPDPCQKCEIIDTDWKKISNTGFGYYTQRGIIEIDKIHGSLHIKSTPDLIWMDNIMLKIEELIKSNEINSIADIQDHSTEDQLDIEIILKKGGDPYYLRSVLYSRTQLQDKKRVNLEVIDGVEVKRMSYKAYIAYFLEMRRNQKLRLYTKRLQVTETRLHEIEIYIKVLKSGDVEKIIHAIRTQKSSDEAVLIEWLMNRLKITDLQAKFILDTKISKLSEGNLKKYLSEQKELSKKVKDLIASITRPEVFDQEIEQELLEIKAKYGKPRQSILISEGNASEIAEGEFKIIITEQNFVKKTSVTEPFRAFRGDQAKCMVIGDNSKDMLLFDKLGKVFRQPIHKISFYDKGTAGIDIRLLNKKIAGDIISAMYLPVLEELNDKKNKYFLVIITKAGYIKKIDLADVINSTPSGIIYSKVNPGDEVVEVLIADHRSDVVVYTRSKALRFSMDSVPYLKRAALGNVSIKSKEPIDGMSVITSKTQEIIVVTNKGRFNKLSQSALKRTERNREGISVIRLSNGDYIKKIFPCIEGTKLRVIRADEMLEVDINDIKQSSTASAGQKVCKEGILKVELIKAE